MPSDNRTEETNLMSLLPEYRTLQTYAERLLFWERHGLIDKLFYYACESKDDAGRELVALRYRLQVCQTWQETLQYDILTLAPYNRNEAHQLTEWALEIRSSMNRNRFVEPIEKLKADFDKNYEAIPSKDDKEIHLITQRNQADKWKKDEAIIADRENWGRLRGIDLHLFGQLIEQLRFAQSIDLASHLSINNAELNWTTIDTYLFARSKYDFALYLEKFDSVLHQSQAKSIKNQQQTGDSLNDDQNTPTLFITPEAKQILYDKIAQSVEKKDHLALSDFLIDGILPTNKITVTSLASKFGLAFFASGAVPDQGAKLLSEQIPNFFNRNTTKGIVDFKPQNLVKYLRGGRK
ncbi:hypothetical protein GO755_10620 [Spirosoma sp. HMF4905]|uniref:Uncharacterized protein n=1 Tax=Spirosoma arboris TaxID=2682092 RepID=A0A7K1S9J3_9BACT|nr:hypothetical protein [Spirosoma arboris]MVM30487.1 hypothetical protein [Spirosoma arboris]